ncbi:MAG: hypothetical protein HFJ64_02635 [Eggerthellaceae bacterium]|nr:hypothetical protein [Eggerthellaceae bacterium]
MNEKDMTPEASQEMTDQATTSPDVTAEASATTEANKTVESTPAATPVAAETEATIPTTEPAPAPTTPVDPAAQPVYQAPMSAPVVTPSPTPALVLGILAIVLCWIPIVGIVLGIIAIVQAGKYFNAGGTESSAKGGRVCGIIGIVLSVIMIVINAVMMFIGLAAFDELNSYSTPNRNAAIESSASSAYVDEEDQAVFDAVDPYLDQLKNKDPQMVTTIANLMEASFDDAMEEYELGITLAACGVDPTELASAMIDGFDYSPDYVFGSGDEAEANYDVNVRSLALILDALYDELIEMRSDINSGDMSEQEVYTQIGTALMNAVKNTEPDESYFDVDVESVDGKWQLDLDSWQDELEYFFSFS